MFICMTILCLFLSVSVHEESFTADNELNPEQLIAKHIKSIGSKEALKSIKNRGFGGTTSFEFIQGGTGNSSGGQFLFVCDGFRVGMILRYADIEYPGEYFAFDGEEVSVGHMKPGQRSPLADFIYRYNSLMKEGLLGGILSSAWPLLSIAERNPKLKCSQRKIDGCRLHELQYQPEKGMGDLRIKLYFDVDTFRHVRTEYKVRISDDMSVQPKDFDIFKSIPDSIYLLVEKFDDFRDAGGLMLPHSYSIDYSIEGQGSSFLGHWTIAISQHIYNGTINPLSFKAHR